MTPGAVPFSRLAPNDVEALVAAICVVAAIVWPRAGKRLFRKILAMLRPLDRRPRLTFAIVVLLPIGLRLALLPGDPPYEPRTMEEHNHLLQAETYLRGRVTNPTHPLAVLFSEFQIVEWPKRVSVRPPGCAIFFWLGDAVFRSATHAAWFGNLISVGLAAGLIYWLLLGWMRPRWATLGALLIVIRYCVFGYWTDSLWGASVPLIGGVLVLGVAPRIRKNAKTWHALALALGMALLAGSRPFEGVVLLLPVFAYLAQWLWRARENGEYRRDMRRFVAPLACAALLILAGQMRYDQITTGRASVMPYQVWRDAQTTVPAFIWQPLSHERLTFYYPQARLFQKWEEIVSHRFDPPRRRLAQFANRHVFTLREVIGPMMLLPFLCWGAGWFRKRAGKLQLAALGIAAALVEFCFALAEHRIQGSILLIPITGLAAYCLAKRWRSLEKSLPLAIVLCGAVATLISSFYMANYLLPFVCAFLVILVLGLRNLSLWDRRRGTGAALAGFLIAGCVAMFGIESATYIAGKPMYDRYDLGRYDFPPFLGNREATDFLTKLGGKHLVFVRYGNNYLSTNEYVWNGPDIDSQKIVWARDLRPEWTAAAVEYYKGRRVWLLDKPDERGPVFERYPLGSLPAPEPIEELPMPYKQIAAR